MNLSAFRVSFELALWTLIILGPLALFGGRALAHSRFRGRSLVEALVALPLVLPPTVLGYYLLVGFSQQSPLGALYVRVMGQPLAFTFQGLVFASVLFNLPFALQPMQRAFEAIPREVLEAADCCGLTPWRKLWRIELPLAWTGVVSGLVLTFVHTLGEFGVVLMMGGNIPGETQTVAIAIYDRVQAFDQAAAGSMAFVLLALSLGAITLSYALSRRRHG